MTTKKKQYGKYPGILKAELTLKYCNELMLHDVIVGLQNRVKHLKNYDVQNERLEEYEYALDFAIYQTKKFGVEIPKLEENKRVEQTESFIKWMKQWEKS